MIKIGILGDIGSGKSHVGRCFGYPVFNADKEVIKLYKSDLKVFKKLAKSLPKFIYSFPINKSEITKAILSNKSNLKKIYNQLEDIIQDYSPIVPLYYDMSVRLVQKNIYGLNNNPFNLLNLKSVYKR